MFNFITSLILVSLLLPTGLNFLTKRTADYAYPELSQQEIEGPTRIINNSLGVETTAKSILVVDENSGTTLYSKNSQAVLPIASITKLMTVLVFLENNPGWDKIITITKDDQKNGGIIYLLPGEQVTVKDLFYLTLVASCNEASIALARSTGIADFTSQMNSKAIELEMPDTYFADVAGLDPANISSPADLIKLAQAAFSQPDILLALNTLEYEFRVLNNGRQGKATNTNKLLESFLNYNNYQIIGAKTGYLDEAGYCLLLKVQKINGPALFLVLLGVESPTARWQEAKGVIDWVFRNYEWSDRAI